MNIGRMRLDSFIFSTSSPATAGASPYKGEAFFVYQQNKKTVENHPKGVLTLLQAIATKIKRRWFSTVFCLGVFDANPGVCYKNKRWQLPAPLCGTF
ncbi:MAG: hypothetical protein IJF22_00125 [Clostridia bacterium]|nr:hypothetical protein [Clostridia bacterium]